MQVSLDEFPPALERGTETALALGTFDGVHLGHQVLLARARALAEERGLQSGVVTFLRPPRSYLAGRAQTHRLLLPPEEKLALLEREVDIVVVADFPKLRELTPEEFARLLRERLRARAVVVGEDYRFGRDRAGDVATLRELGGRLGFQVEALPKVKVDGEEVSATAIRSLIELGEVERAGRLLGRPPLLVGRVVRGTGRGRALGYPTANLEVPEELATPREGVFAAIAELPLLKLRRPGVLYIGRRPTFDGRERSFEVHLLDFTGDLYGQQMRVHLARRLRGELEFADPEELRRQIEQDTKEAQRFFASNSSLM